MAILPLNIARVSDQLRANVALSSMTSAQQQLLTVENQISTGKRVNVPSDDPSAAAIIQQLQTTLAQGQSFSTNLNTANSQLSEADSTLGNLSDLLQQAQNIASQNVGSDSTADQRSSAADVVQTLITQALSIGNTQFEGSYIFGGDRSTAAPFVDSNGSISYVGGTQVLQNNVDESTKLPLGVNGAEVFDALSSQVSGSNLSPAATASTRIVDLGGATNSGVQLGAIKIGNGSTTAVVDLSTADSLGDVATDINAAGLSGVTASVGPNGLVLSGGGNISVNDVGGGTTAADLGILTPTGGGAGVTVTGSNVNAKVTPLTTLASLNGGAGINLSGITIGNGTSSTSISFTGMTTVQDVINAVNNSKAGVTATVKSDGTGIQIVNPQQGTSLSVSENGGTSAADLGIQTTSPSTQLSSFNGGKGVGTQPGPDLQIQRKDGTTFSVDIDGANTVQDVINDINTADAGGGVTASFDASSNGIKLTDTTGGSGSLAVSPLNASTAAKDLGLLNGTTSGNTLTATDTNAVQSTGIFADLQKLQTALQQNDTQGITDAATALQSDYSRVVDSRGANGAYLQDVQNRQSQLQDENTATQSFMSDLQDTDYTTAITKMQTLQTSLQASYMTTARLLGMSLMDYL